MICLVLLCAFFLFFCIIFPCSNPSYALQSTVSVAVISSHSYLFDHQHRRCETCGVPLFSFLFLFSLHLYAVQLLFSSPVVSSDSFLVFILDWFKTAQFTIQHQCHRIFAVFGLVFLVALHSGSFLVFQMFP